MYQLLKYKSNKVYHLLLTTVKIFYGVSDCKRLIELYSNKTFNYR